MPTIKLLRRKRDTVNPQRKAKYQEIYQDIRWKHIVEEKKRINPLCERCEAKNILIPMDAVHHIVPFDWGRDYFEIQKLAFSIENTESVCKKCHDGVHEAMRICDTKNTFLLTNKNMLLINIIELIRKNIVF